MRGRGKEDAAEFCAVVRADVRSILQLCQTLLEETPGAANANAPAEWQPWITMAADDVAKGCDCHWATDILDLVANQIDYCPPRVYRIKEGRSRDPQGTYHTLQIITRNHAQKLLGANYTGQVSSWPRYIVVGAPSDDAGGFRLTPMVSTSVTGGVEIGGFATVGRVWAYDSTTGVPLPLTLSTPYPLPEWSQQACIFRACWYRCLQKMGNPANAGYAQRMGMLERIYREQMGECRALSADWYRETVSGKGVV